MNDLNSLRIHAQHSHHVALRILRDRDNAVGTAQRRLETAAGPLVAGRVQFGHNPTGDVVDSGGETHPLGRVMNEVGRVKNVRARCEPVRQRHADVVHGGQRGQSGEGADPPSQWALVVKRRQCAQRREEANRVVSRQSPQVLDPIIEIVLDAGTAH